MNGFEEDFIQILRRAISLGMIMIVWWAQRELRLSQSHK